MATDVADVVAATQDPVVCCRKHAAMDLYYNHVQSEHFLLGSCVDTDRECEQMLRRDYCRCNYFDSGSTGDDEENWYEQFV